MDLPLIAASLLAFIIFVYVILDGFDLGIGILYPWIKDHSHRDIMMNSVAPYWDGNETWLVFGAALLYGAFPLAYSILLPTLYIPILIMLAALIFRGVAFEFRFKAQKTRFIWDIAFAAGSILATFSQGVILGTFVKGYDNVAGIYQWLTPFSFASGVALVVGYALLGVTWLIGKTSGELQHKMYKSGFILLLCILFFIGIVSIWTPLINDRVFTRWFSSPNIFYLAPLPILTLIAGLLALWVLKKQNVHHEKLPFYFTISVFLFCYSGFCISAWPYIVPHSITVWDAASSTSSLKFILTGVCILLPILIGYTAYAYHVFRGKITEKVGYH